MSKDISLIIADNVNHTLAKFAIEKTLSVIPCKEVITFSDQPIISGAKFVPIKKNINLYDYSEIMTKHLWLYVETEHALVIQWDGMASNPVLWTDEFLNYDYIGALWKWPINSQKVGNGGFSLRSRKLINALRDTEVKLGTTLSGQNEDVAIAVEYRKLMEQKYSIKYAPESVASVFATENVWSAPTFGFHGLWNVPRFLTKPEIEYIIDNIPAYYWNDLSKTQSLINVLVEQDYQDLAHAVYDRATQGTN